jgi:hypothetical protein
MTESGSLEPNVLDEQGILLHNIFELTRNRSKIGIENTNLVQGPGGIATLKTNALGNTNSRLPNICLVDTNQPTTFMNVLKTDVEDSDILLRLTTFELSSLVPLVRIFKVFRNPSDGKEIVLELPFDTKQIGIDDIFKSSEGRGTGAGITSFNWKQNPKNEAATPTFKVTMNIYMQNIQEFFRERNSVMFGNEILAASIEDLLYQRKEWRQQTNQGTGTYNPEDYVIKVIVGWSIGDEGLQSIKDNNPREDVEKFLKALKNQKEVLYLNFVSHTIDFEDTGGVQLQIDFIGRADNTISDIQNANVLTLGTTYEILIKTIRQEIQILNQQTERLQIEDQKQQQDQSSVTKFFGLDTTARDSLDVNSEQIKKLQEKLETVVSSSRKLKYSYFVTRLIQKKQIHLFTYKKELINILSKLRPSRELARAGNEKDIQDFISSQKNKETIQRAGSTGTLNKEMAITDPAKEAVAVLGDTSRFNDEIAQLINIGTDEEQESEILKQSSDLFDLIQTDEFVRDGQIDKKNRNGFAYFYLSSLIDTVIEAILNENNNNANFINKKLRILLGPMSIIDYGSLQDSGQTYRLTEKTESDTGTGEKYVRIYNGKTQSINIGDIPISLKEFQRWFNEHIVNKNIENMTINDFISLILNDLVMSALNNQVYLGVPKQKAKIRSDLFTSITSEHNEQAFLKNINGYEWKEGYKYKKFQPAGGGFRLSLEALRTLKTKGEDAELDQLSEESPLFTKPKDYLVFYCINDSPYERVGDYEEDKKNGILHFYPGESRSTITNVKFSRVDNPNRRADNILAASSEGKGVSKIIREKYNVSLELFGNTSIQVGTYMFLLPYNGGSSITNVANKKYQTSKLLKEIGLGGYYLITEINNTVEIGSFKTELRGVWSAFADGTINDGELELAPAPANTQTNLGIVR